MPLRIPALSNEKPEDQLLSPTQLLARGSEQLVVSSSWQARRQIIMAHLVLLIQLLDKVLEQLRRRRARLLERAVVLVSATEQLPHVAPARAYMERTLGVLRAAHIEREWHTTPRGRGLCMLTSVSGACRRMAMRDRKSTRHTPTLTRPNTGTVQRNAAVAIAIDSQRSSAAINQS